MTDADSLASRSPGQAIFRIAPVRYLAAELIIFGCLLVGMLLVRYARPAGVPVGMLLAFIGGTLATIYYLYRVVGSSGGWIVPLTLLMLVTVILGDVITGNYTVYDASHPGGTHLAVTGNYWLAWGVLLGAVATTVALAAATGERWTRRHLPGNRFGVLAHARGSLAGLWLPKPDHES